MTTKIYLTNGAKTENILSIGASKKSIDPWDESRPGVWTHDPIDSEKSAPRLVPTVFASVSVRMQAMADLPFAIYSVKGDKELDNSDHYKNVVKFLPDPYRFMSLTEGAFCMMGQSYWYKGKGAKTGTVKELTYWRPDSVTLDTDAAKAGRIEFKREGQRDNFPAESVLYSWLPDPLVELGPPTAYPFASVLLAAKASGAISKWVADYMDRGAIKAMMLMVDGMPPPSEVERMESWFNRFMRGTKNLAWKVFNSAGVKPTIVGDGLEALRDLSITEDLRKEINIAMGTQYIFDAQAYATSQKALERQFYQLVIMPDARIIQNDMNEQILHPMGYHIEFEPERLESFQEDEAEQVQAFGSLIDVLMKGLSFDVAFKIAASKLDYQFSDEQMKMIDADLAEEPEEETPEDTVEDTAVESPVEKAPNVNAKAMLELDRWERKSVKAEKVVTWHTAELSEDMVKALSDGSMTFAQAREALKVNPDSVAKLAAAIEKAVNEISNPV